MIAERIQPNVAIVTDVCHDTQTPMIKKIEEGDLACGKGPVLTYGPAVQNNLLDFIISTAQRIKFPFNDLLHQEVQGQIQMHLLTLTRVASALISLPLRYMHTTVEMCSKDDVESVIKLIYHCLLNLKNNQNFSYLK